MSPLRTIAEVACMMGLTVEDETPDSMHMECIACGADPEFDEPAIHITRTHATCHSCGEHSDFWTFATAFSSYFLAISIRLREERLAQRNSAPHTSGAQPTRCTV